MREGLGPAGLEPATSWFVARRSIQLSYGPPRKVRTSNPTIVRSARETAARRAAARRGAGASPAPSAPACGSRRVADAPRPASHEYTIGASGGPDVRAWRSAELKNRHSRFACTREIGAVAPRSLNHPAAIVHARRDQFDRVVLDRWRDDDGVAKKRLGNGAVIELRRRGLHVDGRFQFVNRAPPRAAAPRAPSRPPAIPRRRRGRTPA